jgi:hypothetical protein
VVQYVILLPRQFNDGSPVPDELILQTHDELMEHFEGITFDAVDVSGLWKYEGVTYRDTLRRVTIVDANDEISEASLREYKEVLKQRFDQLEIFISAQQIRML